MRSGTYRKHIKNPDNLINKTLAIDMQNNLEPSSSCFKCDKHKLDSLIMNKWNLQTQKKTNTNGNKKTKEDKNDNKCCLYDIFKYDDAFYNLPKYMLKKKILQNIYNLSFYRAYPFRKLDMNTYQTTATSIELILTSIMFLEKFTFAIKNKHNKIPFYVKRSTVINKNKNENQNENENENEIENENENENDGKKTLKQTGKKTLKQTDNNLILCDVKNPDKAVKTFLDGISNAYSKKNFYPVLIYPKKLKILSYNQTKERQISVSKILEPVSTKHQFVFNDL